MRPPLKSSNLDPSDPTNYPPLSLLPFFSKVLERVVVNQIQKHFDDDNLFDPQQMLHSTETCLLAIQSRLWSNLDASNAFSVWIRTDLSSAFDTIDDVKFYFLDCVII